MTKPLSAEYLAWIAARAEAATAGPWCTDGAEIYQGDEYAWDAFWVGETCRADEADGGLLDAAFIAHARSDVPALLAEVERLRAELAAERALAADATAYSVLLPESGGTEVRVARQSALHGASWSAAIPRRGGGIAWTREGWQEAISALSVDRLFCWPDARTAIEETRRALGGPADEAGESR
ncbi:hypothetical protein [Streptomyces albidoflavus]|uniref:hypothetical protein n=1 Tax=Streptomyces albidoflavus TaxID=1886 RepID=UPI001A91853E|nr:hypothetical protein [Streptomyces albidoflavus]